MDPTSIGQPMSSSGMKVSGRKNKARSHGGSVKAEGGKGDILAMSIHARVQESFSHNLAQMLNDQMACDLQCCMTYGKTCGCIRKFILAGPGWKENNMQNLHIGQNKDLDEEVIATSDRLLIQEPQLKRANELVQILHTAAELKKEKCYTVAAEGADGKPIKELRGMIGLGNGRKRSKKYEDYVLDKRSKLRTEYSLCEKAAQKLLGYSINFLYKKLRTNPQKTSRLVATNKAERASKVPRHLISLQQLREMATNPQGSSQCCCRNCISWLVKHNYEKIVNWRQRLEGSGQRVAQEIVAEVLLASASLDGQNSFCQNLVHWVTGCSFKKIRRVRDHLKKDPKTLPEHGLKKYWKDKANKGSMKGKVPTSSNQIKREKDNNDYYNAMERFPRTYDARAASRTNDFREQPINNLNTNNNRYDEQYRQSNTSSHPNAIIYHEGGESSYGSEPRHSYSNLIREQPQEGARLQPLYPLMDQNNNQAMLNNLSSQQAAHQQQQQNFRLAASAVQPGGEQLYAANGQNFVASSQNFPAEKSVAQVGGNQLQSRGSVIIQPRATQREENVYNVQGANSHNMQDNNAYTQNFRPREEPDKTYSTPFIASLPENNFGEGGRPSYYLAAPGSMNHPQESFLHSGMTPLFLAQAQQPDVGQGDQEGNPASSQFFLLSPALPNNDKGGFDFENWKQMGMPLTPIQMYPAPFISQNGDAAEQKWLHDQQHFMFPMGGDGNMQFAQAVDVSNYSNEANEHQVADPKRQDSTIPTQQPYFPQALTPVAVMPQGGHFLSNVGWIATHMPEQQQSMEPVDNGDNMAKSNLNHGEKFYAEPNPQYAANVPPAANNTNDRYYEPVNRPPIVEWKAPNPVQEKAGVQTTWGVAQVGDKIRPVQAPHSEEAQSQAQKQMPPLAPIPAPTKEPKEVTAEAGTFQQSKLAEDQGASPKGAPIGDRSKRFSRDRLRATIDSPVLLPMTPLSPTLTPTVVPEGGSAAATESSQSPSSSSRADSSFFRFPPAHISRRMAALRMQGQTLHNGSKKDGKEGSVSPSKPEEKTVEEKSPSPVKRVSGGLESVPSLGYIPESLLQGGLGDLSNVKTLPVLSLSSAGWTDDTNMNVTVKESANSDSQLNQQLKTPIAVLEPPTSQQGSSPSGQLNTPNQPLNTPTQSLNTPNQLNTPTQPLNTPTQPLNTPTHDLTSPSANASTDEDTLVKELLPAPVGKKRKADQSVPSAGEKSGKLRFHHFTPQDWDKDGFTPTAYIKTDVQSASEAEAAKKERNRRKQNKPKPVHENSDQSSSDTPDPQSSPEKSASSSQSKQSENPNDGLVFVANPLQLSNMKTPLLQRFAPLFSAPPPSSSSEAAQSSAQNQITTPVFLHSITPSNRISSSFIRMPSSTQGSAAISSTPQIFTFVQGPGFSTPTVFFASGDPKRSKAGESSSKSNQDKRVPRTLPISQSAKDDSLQTPSKIPVVTPSAALNSAGLLPASDVIFSFNEHVIQKKNLVAQEKPKPPEKSGQSPSKESSPSQSDKCDAPSEKQDDSIKPPPSVIVNPPSDAEEENEAKKKAPEEKRSKKTLHRVRSGGKSDLVISLKDQSGGGGGGDAEPTACGSNSLDTPSAIQVITPTITNDSSKNGSPVKRLPQSLRVHPQPLVVAPICLNPQSSQSASMQVQTPTFFHIISPSQPTPPSPSVLVYPFARGFGSVSGARTASPGNTSSSAAFGIVQRGGSVTGSNSGSLLKSALMKKLPVFQFPPPTSTPTSGAAEKSESSSAEQVKSPVQTEPPSGSTPSTEAGAVTQESSASASATAVSVICRPPASSAQLADKLSGANDPCLSEAAQNDL